jgi:hypothetical protein
MAVGKVSDADFEAEVLKGKGLSWSTSGLSGAVRAA